MPEAHLITAPPARTRRPRVDPKLAARVHEALTHAEHCLDQAFIATAELTTLLPSVRGQTTLAFEAPQDAIEAGTVAIASLTRARSDLRDMHRRLADLQTKLRVPATSFGGLEDKIPTG